MADNAHLHPEKDQLLAFGLGKLGPDEAETIAQHLERCDECSETIVSLQDDTFVTLVRSSPPPTPIDEAELDCDESPEVNPEITINIPAGVTGSDESSPSELPPELRQHPRYEILQLIGRGGMGDVYQAQHKVMNRVVALKLIKPQLVRNAAAVGRFRREVQAAASLRHPNIVTAFDAEQAGNLHFLVMEYVDGTNLDEVISTSGQLSVRDACDYISQASEGLQHAHDQGMVHRDIKPHNLMIEQQRGTIIGSATVVKILDFGLANFANEVAAEKLNGAGKVDTSEDSSPPHNILPGVSIVQQLTQMGTMMGTPDYIAPEQALDAHTADIRSDIYSLGCTFYTLLTGKPPFGDGSVLDKIKAHSENDAPPISDSRDDVPAEVEAILQKMMAKDPAHRYQTPAEVAEALNSVAPSFQLDTTVEKVRQAGSLSPRRRRPLMLTAVATLFVALIAATVFYIQTNKGVVRVEVGDPSLKVTISGQTITMQDGEQRLKIRAGEQKLIIRRGDSDFEFETDNFQIRRGDQIAFKVELLPGEVVVGKDGQRFGAKSLRNQPQYDSPDTPLVIGMNEQGGTIFEGRLVTSAELSRLLREALTENPDRAVSIDIPKKPQFVAPIVDQLENIARATGAKRITRPTWSQIRVVFDNSGGNEVLHVQGPGFDATGFVQSMLPNVQEVIEKNPGLRVVLDIGNAVDPAAERNRAVLEQVREHIVAAGGRFDSNSPLELAGKLAGDGSRNYALLYLPDGKRLVSGGKGEHLVVWDVATGKQLQSLPWNQPIRRMALLPDGRVVTNGDVDGVRIWNLDEPDKSVDLPGRGVGGLAVSPDGKFLLTTTTKLHLWDLATMKELHSADANCRGAAFINDGKQIVHLDHHRVLVRDVASFETVRTLAEISPHRNLLELAASEDGKYVAFGDIEIFIVELSTGKEIGRIPCGSTTMLRSLVFLPGSHMLLAGDDSPRIQIIDASRGEVLLTHTPPSHSAWCLAVSPDLSTVAASGGNWKSPTGQYLDDPDKSIYLWSLPKSLRPEAADTSLRDSPPIPQGSQLAEILRLDDLKDYVLSVAFSPDGRHLVTASGNPSSQVVLWDARNGRREKVFDGHRSSVHRVQFSPDGKLIASAGKSSDIVLLDAESLEEQHRLLGHTGVVCALAISPDGRHVASGSENWNRDDGDVTVRVWDLETKQQRWSADLPQDEKMKGQIEGLAFSPDGNRLATVRLGGPGNNRVAIWETTTGKRIREFGREGSAVKSIAWSPDGKLIATGHSAVFVDENQWQDPENCVIRIFDADTGEEVRKLTGHKSAIDSLAFSPDSRVLASGSGGQYLNNKFYEKEAQDNTVRLWDIATGQELLRQDMGKAVKCAQFSPDGQQLVTSAGAVGQRPEVVLWRLPESVSVSGQRSDGSSD